jgi:hypothetical protein
MLIIQSSFDILLLEIQQSSDWQSIALRLFTIDLHSFSEYK